MTFFYDLNKKLDSIREKPEVTHGQLNERDMGKHNNATTGFAALAKKAGKEYGSKAAGERVAGAQFQKMKKAGQIEEEGMSRAAKGYEKYGKEGMQALAKAGREGKALDPVRAKYDKYDNKEVDEGLGDVVKKVGGAVLNKLGHGSDKDMRKDLQRKMGMTPTGDKPDGALKYAAKTFVKHAKDPLGLKNEAGLPMTTVNGKKVPKFAADGQGTNDLAKKKTFADKIAGAKKEVDEMLGDVAAEAMKSALSGGQKKLDKNNNGKLDANDFAMLRRGGKKEVADEGFDDMMKDVERRRNAPKIGSITHGSKHDVEEIPGGRRVTRRVDPNTGHSVGADDDGSADGEKRGRGRPKGTKGAIGAKGPSGRSKLMTREGDNESDDIKQAMALLKKAGYKVSKAVEEESTTTRDNRAERAGRKVAKDIEYDEKKKDGIQAWLRRCSC
jgi:hypothetical protein